MASRFRDDALTAVRKQAQRIRAENPLLAEAFTEQEVVKAIITEIASQETTLAGAIGKALVRPSSAPFTRDIAGAVCDPAIRKSATAKPEADLSPAGFDRAIKKAREDRAAKPNEPEMSRRPR
jgi:hypothetical protein